MSNNGLGLDGGGSNGIRSRSGSGDGAALSTINAIKVAATKFTAKHSPADDKLIADAEVFRTKPETRHKLNALGIMTIGELRGEAPTLAIGLRLSRLNGLASAAWRSQVGCASGARARGPEGGGRARGRARR